MIFWQTGLGTFLKAVLMLIAILLAQSATASMTWEKSSKTSVEGASKFICLFAVQMKPSGTYDATIRWRSGKLRNKWVDKAKSSGLSCNVGKRLTRLLEMSGSKWNSALEGILAGWSVNKRCEMEPFDNCRGFRISKDGKQVLLGNFKFNKFYEGAIFTIDGTNASVVGKKAFDSYPLRAIIFGNNEYIIINGNKYDTTGTKELLAMKQSLFLQTSDGAVFSTTTTPPFCGRGVQFEKGKTCLALSIQDNSVFFGEAGRDAVHLRINGQTHYVGPHYIPDGTGIRVASDGSRYFGEFKDGLRHGPGTFTNSDGSTEQSGQWKINVNYSKSVLPDYFNGFDTASILIQPNEQEAVTAAVPTTLVKKPETKPTKSNQIAVANVEGDELCRTVKGQLKNHVAQSDYEKAEQALSLLKKLDCVSGQSQATVSPNEPTYTQPTPSPAIISSPPSPKPGKELSCQAGPFFKPGLVTKPKTYHATSFDNNPRSNCSVAAKKCGSLAKIKLSRFKKEGSGSSSDSYTSRCSRYTGECTISRGSNSSGGFVGGLLEGLNDRANENEFFDGVLTECMIEEGFNITGR